MVNVKCRKCIVCNKTQPQFNLRGVRPATHCRSCKLPEMVDVMSSKCVVCLLTRPTFNTPGQSKATHCGTCKTEGMVDIKNRRCIVCKLKVPCYNVPGAPRGTHCRGCKVEGMIDVRSTKCDVCRQQRPIYNHPGQTRGTHCSACKLSGMVNVKTRMCVICKTTVPVYNVPGQARGSHCGACKLAGMIDVVNKRCQVCEEKYPIYNLPGNRYATHCSGCKLSGMVDVVSRRCSSDHCDTIVAANRNEGYCLHCFIHRFPNKPVARNYKTKESAVVHHVTGVFGQFDWVTDKTVSGGCSRRRPDQLADFGSHVVIVEIDENMHRAYDCSCDNKRIMQLILDVNPHIQEDTIANADVGCRPIVFIRFNPDKYINAEGNSVPSCWTQGKDGIIRVTDRHRVAWRKRLQALTDQIEHWSKFKPEKMVEVVQLYYDQI